MNFRCFITLWLLKEDTANTAKTNAEIMREIITNHEGIVEATKFSARGRRVTIIARLKIVRGQSNQETVYKICKAISEETGRKVKGKLLKE